ncbi:cytochrome C oxidase subunit IV family protein [Stigmatella sp. ncwal1]|uniref:Cytochrome C oxidase subunit IV family protein n=1 Tax=Stigmatella ashevillensis TaxID=2995309 RepID=A0ABT5D967_9BACT|nr:cytochrome C oxidase subunit IV family protein [Stigmatella ashevillena]MDC0710121.1 cytochrome C oxidase subunit IV family protein [Stigmatella ashevillena]
MAVVNETHSEEHNMQEHHGTGRYWLVWAALLAFTFITVITGRMHLPTFGLLLALVIATVKGTLVLLFFMHLIDHKGANRLVMGVSLVFVLIMIMAPMADFATRFRGSNPPGSHVSDLKDLNFPEAQGDAKHGGSHGLKLPDSHP